MLSDIINTCTILTFSDEDYEAFSGIYKHNAVKVEKVTTIPAEFTKPTIIVGKYNMKKFFPEHEFLESKIKRNLYWCFSLTEDRKKALSDTKKIIDDANEMFLLKEYFSYDFILDGDFVSFMNELSILNKKEKLFVYFYTTACYIYHNKRILCINLESLKVNNQNFKLYLTTLFNEYDTYFLNYENIYLYINVEELKSVNTFENIFWTKYAIELLESDFNGLFPEIINIRKFMPFLMSHIVTIELSEAEKLSALKFFRKDIITGWLSKQEIFFNKSFESDRIDFSIHNGQKYKRLKYSNKRAITGRINCIDKQINPQNLPKDGEIRKHIVSRYQGGKIVVIDYVSFETKVSLYLSGDQDFIDQYQYSDLHVETAKVIFQNNTISAEQRAVGKAINHTLLYGGGKEKLKNILRDIPNNEEALIRVRTFLKPIITKIEEINKSFEQGYIINDSGTIVRPNKGWAIFNNYISSTATDIVIEKLFEIKEYIRERKINLMYQVHDSFVFDVHPEELENIEDFVNFISHFKNTVFQVDCKIGNSLFDCA